MSASTPRLENSIRMFLAPVLKEDGFAGSGRTFRRLTDGLIQVVNIQGSSYGGRFAINLGLQPIAIPDVSGNMPDLKKITEPLCEFRRRLAESGSDQWWQHDTSQSSMDNAVAAATDVYITIGRSLFDRVARSPSPFDSISVEDFQNGNFDFCGFGSTEVRMALVLARMRKAQGRIAEAAAFGEYGLAHVGNAAMLRFQLKQVAQAS